MAACAACCACSSSPSEERWYSASLSAMALNSDASAAISSRPFTRARAARSPVAMRWAACATTETGRTMRVVTQLARSVPATHAHGGGRHHHQDQVGGLAAGPLGLADHGVLVDVEDLLGRRLDRRRSGARASSK